MAIASPAHRAMRENFDQSGSTSKSQCDLLLGSFHSITASIIRQSPARPPRARLRDRQLLVASPGGRAADKHFFFGIAFDHEPGTAQNRRCASAVGDPPVGVVTGIAMLDEGEPRESPGARTPPLPKTDSPPRPARQRGAAALQRLADKEIADDVVADQIERQQRMPKMIEHARETAQCRSPAASAATS